MCLITFNWLDHSQYKLIIVTNRDEFFDRPSAPLHMWDSGFYGGKDLRGGGTWMGMHPNGRFAAVTNYRDLYNLKKDPITRGHLVKDFLEGNEDPLTYLLNLKSHMHKYDGFNLLVAHEDKMFYLSNYGDGIIEISPGIHTLSNILIDSDWAKEQLAYRQLKESISQDRLQPDDLLGLLKDSETLPDELLPNTGATLVQERALSSQFVVLGDYYGTVNSSAILWSHDGKVVFKERTYSYLEPSEDNLVLFKMNTVNQEL